MTQKSAKKKGKKSTKASAQPGVLGSLPARRPERIGGGGRRASRTSATTALADEARAKPAATTPAAKPGPTRAEAKAATKSSAAKPAAAKAKKAPQVEAAKAKAKAAKAKPAKPAKPEAAKAKPAKPEAAKAKPVKPEAAKAAKVKPVKRVVPKTAAGPKPPPLEPGDGRPGGPPRGTEIVTTAVQAAGELAQIGVTVGGQLLRRAARRIPRP